MRRQENDRIGLELSRPFTPLDPNQHYDYHGPAGEIELTGIHHLTANDFIL